MNNSNEWDKTEIKDLRILQEYLKAKGIQTSISEWRSDFPTIPCLEGIGYDITVGDNHYFINFGHHGQMEYDMRHPDALGDFIYFIRKYFK